MNILSSTRGFPKRPLGPNTWDVTIQTTATNQGFGFTTNSANSSYSINWGDGATQSWSGGGSGTSISHIYAAIGTYTIRITFITHNANQNVKISTGATRARSVSAAPLNAINTYNSMFQNCDNITSFPQDLFWYARGLNFGYTFRSCSKLTSIPVDFFRYSREIANFGFNNTFLNCTSLTSIPVDIFRYQDTLTTNAFNSTFAGCTGLNGFAIDADLLRYNTNLSGTNTALGMFAGVTLDTVAYSNLLISLDTYLPQSNLGFGGGNSKYNSSASTARANLVARGWSIVDGGLA